MIETSGRRHSVVMWIGALALIAASCGGTPDSAVPSTSPSTTTTQPRPMTDAELAAALGAAVFKVESVGCGSTSVGTAFAIDDTHLVTNHHVVQGDDSPQLVSRDGVRLRGEVIGWSEDPDIAVIRVPRPLTEFLEWAAPSDLAEGERTIVMGYPQPNHGFTVTSGAIQSFVTEGQERIAVEVDVTVDYGSSGSPALTDDGLVAGVVAAVDTNPGGLRTVPLMLPVDQVQGVVDYLSLSEDAVMPDCLDDRGTTADVVGEYWADCPFCGFQLPTLESETPPFPTSIEGYRTDGVIHSEEIRVFPGRTLSAPFYFDWADHDCPTLWTARWRTLGAGSDLVGVVVPPYYSEPDSFFGYYWPDPGSTPITWEQLVESSGEWLVDTSPPTASSSGMLAGAVCDLPAWFNPDSNSSNLVDIVVDWLYWDPAP